MIGNLEVKDQIKLRNEQIHTVHKIYRATNNDRVLYGLCLDPECMGNYEWYYESGKPVSYWANEYLLDHVFKPKTIVDIIKVT